MFCGSRSRRPVDVGSLFSLSEPMNYRKLPTRAQTYSNKWWITIGSSEKFHPVKCMFTSRPGCGQLHSLSVYPCSPPWQQRQDQDPLDLLIWADQVQAQVTSSCSLLSYVRGKEGRGRVGSGWRCGGWGDIMILLLFFNWHQLLLTVTKIVFSHVLEFKQEPSLFTRKWLRS